MCTSGRNNIDLYTTILLARFPSKPKSVQLIATVTNYMYV